jgi:oleandomycin transport system permease protein
VRHQPLTAVLTPARDLILGGQVAGALPEAALWIAGLLLVFVPLATRRFRKAFA